MKYLLFLTLLFSSSLLFAQDKSIKESALQEFEKEHYNEAINILEKALLQTTDDPEIYYYLGLFNHYRASDSRPLVGYNYSYSEKILEYLDKALKLNPNYGDAKYFYGTECGVNACISMQNYDLQRLKYFYKIAYQRGAYPDWLLEFGRKMLSSCNNDAILFTGGDADFDVCMYLQLHEKFRNDITLIPIGNIDRPWYVLFLKKGLNGGVRNIKINLTEEQIMDIHPFKWDTTLVSIQVSTNLKNKYGLRNDYKMQWKLAPDLFSERIHSKIEGENSHKRKYLSPQRAILLQIIEDNYQDRPIFFAIGVNPFFLGELDLFLQHCGLVSELLPFNTDKTGYKVNYNKLEQLFKKNSFKYYASIKKNNIPRISGMVFNYHNASLLLARYYKDKKMIPQLESLIDLYKKDLAIDYDSESEDQYLKELIKLME
jgi:tetratricopeptide (TPR) repeat protein